MILLLLLSEAVGALSMPTTIDSGYYSCVGPSTECTVPATKTTLNVQNMISDAVSGGNTSATFTAIRLTFLDALVIDAPTTTTVAASPIHIRIEDAFTNNLFGSSGALYLIKLEGILSSGSSLHIKGGSFIEKLVSEVGLLRVLTSLELNGGSTILVENIVADNKLLIWEAIGPTVITGGSSVEYKNCSVASAQVHTFYIGLLTLSDGSSFAIRSCTIHTENPGSNYIFIFSKGVNVSTSSLFEIAGNTLIHTSTLTSPFESIVKFFGKSIVSTDAKFRFVANTIIFTTKTRAAVIYPASELAISEDGEVEISRNNFTVSGVTTMSIFYCPKTFPVVGTGSKLTIDENFGSIYYSSVTTTTAQLFYFASLALTNSTFSCRNNELTITATQIAFIYIYKELTVSGSTMFVDVNTITARHAWTGFFTSMLAHVAVIEATTISSSSIVSICDNSLLWYSTASDSFGFVDQAVGYFDEEVVVEGGSDMRINGNTVDTIGETKSVCLLSVLRCPSLLINTQSKVSLDNTVVTGSLTSSAGGNVAGSLLRTTVNSVATSLLLSESSSLSISHNHFVCNISSTSTSTGTATLLSALSKTSVTSGSLINISHNYVGGVEKTKKWTYMMHCESGLSLQNSQLIMSNATVRISYLDPAFSSINLLFIQSYLTLTDASTLLLDNYHTYLGFLPDTIGNVAGSYMIYEGLSTVSLAVSGGSAIELAGLTLQSTEPGNILYAVRPRVFNVVTTTVYFNESSSLRIVNNIMVADRYESTLLYVAEGITSMTLTGNVSITISGNTIPTALSDTTVAHFLLAHIETLFYMVDGASLTFNNNTIVRNNGMARILYTTKLRQSANSGPITVDGNTLYGVITSSDATKAAFQITEALLLLLPPPNEGTIPTAISFSNNTIVNTIQGSLGFSFSLSGDLMVFQYEGAFNYSSTSSSAILTTTPQTPTILVSRNNVTFTGSSTTVTTFGCMMIYFNIDSFQGQRLHDGSIIKVVSNTLTATSFVRANGFVLEWATSGTTGAPTLPTVLSVEDNTVVADTLIRKARVVNMEGLGSASTTRITLLTCGNALNNQMCHETAQNTHSCVDYSASQVTINDCQTSTLTPSYTPSPTLSQTTSSTLAHTNSPTLTSSLTLTDTHPLSQSDPPSSTLSKQTPTASQVSSLSSPPTRSLTSTVSSLQSATVTHPTTQSDPLSSTPSRIPTPSLSSNHTPTLEATPSLTHQLSTTRVPTPTISPPHTPTYPQTPTPSATLHALTSTSTPTLSPQTHSLTAGSTLSLPPSATVPPTPTSTITTSPSPSTTHPTATPSKSESVNTVNPAFLCKMGCAAVTSAHLAGVDVTTGPCSSAMIPFEATRDDVVANVVMHLSDDARQRINASVNVSEKVSLRTELLSDGKDGAAALVEMWGLREGAEYREVRLHVRRDDVTPLNRLDVRVALPAYCFLCRHDNDAVGGGLPWVDVSLSAPPAVLSGAALAVVTAGAAASSLLTTDLQTVAAMGMLGCAPRGDDSGESDNVRALVPVSLGDTCEEAVWGALITMAGVGLLTGAVVLILRRVKGLPWTQTCAAVFSPSIFLQTWGMLQMGLVVCGGRLVQQEQGSVVVGCVGLLVGLAIVPCYIILANRVISRRCYRLGLTDKAPRNKAVRAVMYVVLPRYELNKEEMPACKAFTVVVGRTRYRWSGWAGIWVLQPVVMLMCVFAKGELCLGMYIASAACLGLLGLLHLIVRPHRTLLPNLLTCIALFINGGLVLVGSMLAYDPLDPVLRDISYHLSLAQTVLTVIRILLQVSTFLFMRVMRLSWFQAVSGDGVVVDKPEPVFEVIGWLDPPTKEGSASPSVGLLTLEEHDDDDLSSISTEAVPMVDRGGDVESVSHPNSDDEDEDEMTKIDVSLVERELGPRQEEYTEEYTHEHDDVKEDVVVEEIPPTCPDHRRVQEELPPPPSSPRRPPVVVNHQIGKIGSQNHQLGGALGIDLPSNGDQGPSATSVIGGLESQGNVVVQPDEIDVLLQDFEGEVIIHNHVYNEGGMMVATSAGGARVQALNAESTAHIPIPHPPNYVRPCASDTARHNLTELIEMICERQQGRGRILQQYQQSDVPVRHFK